ncbi:MAG: calcium/sodium antiporter [Sandaracinaceae bacterium]|nr:calcium/sodium antiporter [Sandaracinaceae bacterium]
MDVWSIAGVIAGTALTVGGAELLVRGAARIARRFGISPLVVGLTVVAFGTSAPEIVIGLVSVLRDQPDLAVGNVVGSTTFNILGILGVSALIAPLVVAQKVVRLEAPILIAAALAVLAMARGGTLDRLDGALLLAGGVGYTLFLVRRSRHESAAVAAEYEAELGAAPAGWSGHAAFHVLLVLVGLALLAGGAELLVGGAAALARALGISELVIGTTVVAIGTSLPELATSTVAALRGERDIAVGNVMGSCLFNLFVVLGISALASPVPLPVAADALRFDLPIMVAACVSCLPIFATDRRIDRWEGGTWLVFQLAYLVVTTASAVGSAYAPTLELALIGLAGPLVALTFGVLGLRWLRRRVRERGSA